MAATSKPKPGLRLRKLADRTSGERVRLTRVPAGAFTIDETTGDAVFDPAAATSVLVNPATPGFDHEPWPFAGIRLEGGDPPKTATVSTSFVQNARAEGWMTVEGEQVVHRPGGPPEQPWRVTHTFVHADALVLHTVDGDVRYTVTQQPDKWPAEKNDRDEGFGGDVRWFYELKLEATHG